MSFVNAPGVTLPAGTNDRCYGFRSCQRRHPAALGSAVAEKSAATPSQARGASVQALRKRITLQVGQGHLLQAVDLGLFSLVKSPLLDSFGPYQAGMAQDLKVFACSRLADAQLTGDQQPTNAVIHQAPIHLWSEMLCRVFEPVQYLQSAIACERSKREVCIHIDSSLSTLL
jgi:hypothetical protein